MKLVNGMAAAILLALVLTSPLFPDSALRPDHGSRDVSGTSSAGLSTQPVAAAQGAVSGQVAGVATWCDEAPPYCIGWGEPALLGAVPGFTYGDAPYTATVCRSDGAPCVDVTVVSFCACGDRPTGPTVIDLSPAAFKAINDGSLAAGVIDVVVTFGGTALPATDTAP